ncbi:MAG: P27 family phage terminase small subunit [Bacillota bacterium]|jgi:phage terminase small subunit
MAKSKKLQIKQDLIDQLERQAIYGQHYLDLINDYMELWDIKNRLIKDIKERGVSIRWETYNKDGEVVQSGYKKNESIAELNKTSAQMLKILSELGLKAKPMDPDPEMDEEM